MNYYLASRVMRKQGIERGALTWIAGQEPNNPHSPKHLHFMLLEIMRGEMNEGKAGRWLGWVQSSLCFLGFYKLEELKALNKACSCDDEGCPQFGSLHIHEDSSILLGIGE